MIIASLITLCGLCKMKCYILLHQFSQRWFNIATRDQDSSVSCVYECLNAHGYITEHWSPTDVDFWLLVPMLIFVSK